MAKQKIKKRIYPLTDLPDDVRNFLMLKAGEIKSETGEGKYSLEKVIYKIIRFVRDNEIKIK